MRVPGGAILNEKKECTLSLTFRRIKERDEEADIYFAYIFLVWEYKGTETKKIRPVA